MKRFIDSQGSEIDLNILYQDNMSTIKLAENGKKSLVKRTRHFDIKYFYITDLRNQKEISMKFYSSDDMLPDYQKKPLIGEKLNHEHEQCLISRSVLANITIMCYIYTIYT